MDTAEPLFQQILELHQEGYGYGEIARKTGLYAEQVELILTRYQDQNTTTV